MRIVPKSLFSIVLAFLFSSLSSKALAPDEILLLVNKNVPEGAALAEFYKTARLIPDGRVCVIAVPPIDDISFENYETLVVPTLRDFLRQNKLQNKIRCIVPFYGVPLRIAARKLSADEQVELADIQKDLAAKTKTIADTVDRMEIMARQFNPAFSPAAGTAIAQLDQRARAAFNALSPIPATQSDPEQRAKTIDFLRTSLVALGGPAENPDAPSLPELKKKAEETRASIQSLLDRRYDPDARAMIRKLADENLGAIEQAFFLSSQADYFSTDKSGASLDSELALLWWNYYPRASWQLNPYYYPLINQRTGLKEILLVSRLDAPQSGLVRQMILTSLNAERDGLKGRIVLDSRGIKTEGDNAQVGSYGWYDQSIRDLVNLVKSKTKIALTVDDAPEMLPPNSTQSVAMYCGWYSVRNYSPICRFNPGAIALHVASLECISLRGATEKGWCKGLLEDGAAATMGAVAEPYLHAFPRADDFFSLMMTGKIPLAEAYWRTNPLASWQMTLLGDPLYTPYKKTPAISVDDLPDRLKPLFKTPATQPIAEPIKTLPLD